MRRKRFLGLVCKPLKDLILRVYILGSAGGGGPSKHISFSSFSLGLAQTSLPLLRLLVLSHHITSPARLTASLPSLTPIFNPYSHQIPRGHLQKNICLSDNGKFILNSYFRSRSIHSLMPPLLICLFWRVVFARLKGHAGPPSAFRQDCLPPFMMAHFIPK